MNDLLFINYKHDSIWIMIIILMPIKAILRRWIKEAQWTFESQDLKLKTQYSSRQQPLY